MDNGNQTPDLLLSETSAVQIRPGTGPDRGRLQNLPLFSSKKTEIRLDNI